MDTSGNPESYLRSRTIDEERDGRIYDCLFFRDIFRSFVIASFPLVTFFSIAVL